MSVEERLAQNHVEFQQLLDRIEEATESRDYDTAIRLAESAASQAWLKGCGIFSSARLESLLTRIGRALPDVPLTPRQTTVQRRVLTVLTTAYAVGGHTRLACRWITLDEHSHHTTVITRQEGTPLPAMIAALAEHNVTIKPLTEDTPVARALRLRQLLADTDFAVLHVHPNDALPIVALAGMASPPAVVFEDHAGHVFWLGASVSNLVVTLSDGASRITAKRRGVNPAQIGWMPIPLDFTAPTSATEIDLRARHGIPADAPLLLSCGATYKFMPIDGVSQAELLAPILRERSDVHLVQVGPAFDPPGTSLAMDFPGRVHHTGNISNPAELHAAYAACDVYLDVAPFPSNTALCEAVATGKPALKFAPRDWSECGFAIDLDAVPLPVYAARDADEYRHHLLALLDSAALRTQHAATMSSMLRACHADAYVQTLIEAHYTRAARLPLIDIDEAASSYRVELLDTLLAKLADNLQVSQTTGATSGTTLPIRMLSPDEQYRHWLAAQKLGDKLTRLVRDRLDHTASVHVLVVLADGDTPEQLDLTLQSLLRQSNPAFAITVLGDTTSPLPAGIATMHAPAGWIAASTQVAHESHAEWLLPLRAGDMLVDHALLLLADMLRSHPELACCYADEDTLGDEGPTQPIFKPDVNLDLLRSYPYTGQLMALRRLPLLEIGGLSASASALATSEFALRSIERFGLPSVGHLAELILHARRPFAHWLADPAVADGSAAIVSAHLDRLGIAHELMPTDAAGVNRVHYLCDRQPPVSIIIPTRDQLPMLNGLIDSLLAKTSYKNYELLIVDNDSREPATCAYLDGIEKLANPQLRVLRWPHPFNYSAINNFAASQARGEYLILLNNDTAVLHEDWIEALLNHAQRPEVGIVGAKLHYPDGRIQHGGVVLGLRGPADHPYIGAAMDAPGYMHRLLVDQNYTAVTAACLMIRKSVYDEVGGLDEEAFKVSYNDVDLCLKVHQAGYLAVWTPYARLMHEGSVSQKKVDTSTQTAKFERFKGEQAHIYRKWLPLLARDPAYNRNLSLAGNGFDLDHSRVLDWQPFEQTPLPHLFCIAADEQGCGHYRVIQPFRSMQREGMACGLIAPQHLYPVPMERLAPTSIVLQRQFTDGQVAVLRSYRDYSRAFKVYELDDYLPNVPLKSMHRDAMPKDLMKSLRKAVALTDRFVVSTAPLAEAFAGLHSDIRVVPNRLPVDWWGELHSQRRYGTKPRVGWAGGNSHRGDLELIVDVMRELADEVEWVIFGLCPDKLRPYVHDLRQGVPISQYPAALASLDLDLALAPLEDNIFNACKSNLRLLEYGACGYPVICSDIVCYRDQLPVTRVRNRFKEWVDAIRMHLTDLDATAKMGDALREAVHRDWMLTGDNLLTWRKAWLPD